jgi:hypothetical protein
VFCMLFCLRSFSIHICRKYTNNYLNINELFLEIPCSLTYPGEMKTKPQMPRCQWQQYSNKKGGLGRLGMVCFLTKVKRGDFGDYFPFAAFCSLVRKQWM